MMRLIFGSGVPEDPLQIDKLLRSIEESARLFLPREEHAELVALSRGLIAACHAALRDEAEPLATTVETAVELMEYRFEGQKLAAYSLGRYLRRWDMATTAAQTLSPGAIDAVVAAARTLVAGESLVTDIPWTCNGS
jgi:hypothetical protein